MNETLAARVTDYPLAKRVLNRLARGDYHPPSHRPPASVGPAEVNRLRAL